jgi:hypothetical protein
MKKMVKKLSEAASEIDIAIAKAVKKFVDKQRSASKDLIESACQLEGSSIDYTKDSTTFKAINSALQRADQETLCNFLEQESCPDWLGIWAARHGKKQHQVAYLFRPSLGEEPPISERIGSRPQKIKRMFCNSRAALVISTLLEFDDETYLDWARDIGFDMEIKPSNFEPKDNEEYVPAQRGQIDDWLDSVLDPIVDALWKEHVPEKGACTVLQGELARCIGRLEREYWKNGMMNMGDGYYDRMVDKVKDAVLSKNSFSPLVKRIVGIDAGVVKGANYAQIRNSSLMHPTDVEQSLRRLKNVVAAWCLKNKEPIPYTPRSWD